MCTLRRPRSLIPLGCRLYHARSPLRWRLRGFSSRLSGSGLEDQRSKVFPHLKDGGAHRAEVPDGKGGGAASVSPPPPSKSGADPLPPRGESAPRASGAPRVPGSSRSRRRSGAKAREGWSPESARVAESSEAIWACAETPLA